VSNPTREVTGDDLNAKDAEVSQRDAKKLSFATFAENFAPFAFKLSNLNVTQVVFRHSLEQRARAPQSRSEANDDY
jgi:hypothetical protein